MSSKRIYRLAAIRFLVFLVASAVLIALGSEAIFLAIKDPSDRAPQQVTLVIPEGTAQKVAAGQDVTSIPAEMTFVVGDTLVVKNEDTSTHQLGPVWVPAKSSANLALGQANNMAYECSFSTSRYFGLDVRQPTSFWTRIQGLMMASPITAIMAFVYSILVWPLDGKKAGKTPDTGLNVEKQ
jgi:hypothetical protein